MGGGEGLNASLVEVLQVVDERTQRERERERERDRESESFVSAPLEFSFSIFFFVFSHSLSVSRSLNRLALSLSLSLCLCLFFSLSLSLSLSLVDLRRPSSTADLSLESNSHVAASRHPRGSLLGTPPKTVSACFHSAQTFYAVVLPAPSEEGEFGNGERNV